MAALVIAACESDTREYDCAFDHISDTYRITAWELTKTDALITVHRDGRTFMFRRNALKHCIEVTHI